MDITGTDRYKIESTLGQGASGIVYRAWDREFNRHVAIKIAHKAGGHFIAEDRLVGNLVHKNIVTIYKVESMPDISYISMEYINGPDLRKFCEKITLLKPQMVIAIMIDVLKGLFYAHGKGFIHKNIKPSNIIINEKGIPMITDFGIAQMAGKNLQPGSWGTPEYMSPEQLKGKEVTMQSDIFSLGCVLYEMLGGKSPFRADNQYSVINQIINKNPETLGTAMPCREILDAIINKSLSKDPAGRYHRCSDFAFDLSKALGIINRQDQLKKASILRSITDRVNVFKTIAASTRG